MALPPSILNATTNPDDPPKHSWKSFLHRKSQPASRPSISWPIESHRESAPDLATPTFTGNFTAGHQPHPSIASSIDSSTALSSTAPLSPGVFSDSELTGKPLENHPRMRHRGLSVDHLRSFTIPRFTGASLDNLYNPSLHTRSYDLDYDKQSQQTEEDIDISDKPPSSRKWHAAGEVLIYDQEGKSRTFRSLYDGDLAIGEQQLIIFVRHFFCGACQSYLRTLSKALPLKTYFTLPVPSSITIIGLGSPSLVPQYRAYTGCPFPIYADPTKQLYRLLGMGWTVNPGRRSGYMEDGHSEEKGFSGQLRQLAQTDPKLGYKGGNWLWVGGEFLVKEGTVTWCRRMRSYRGHSDVRVIRRLLGAEE